MRPVNTVSTLLIDHFESARSTLPTNHVIVTRSRDFCQYTPQESCSIVHMQFTNAVVCTSVLCCVQVQVQSNTESAAGSTSYTKGWSSHNY